ncbi:hypothetical protein [Isoalcanivorax beigongshangi]|uniref:DUF2946 domain-containing protein n=1 Tax=Isoalcanivorax beigongshangi TaxID=3238810 RepID=A0ABV4AHH9_9GAMM
MLLRGLGLLMCVLVAWQSLHAIADRHVSHSHHSAEWSSPVSVDAATADSDHSGHHHCCPTHAPAIPVALLTTEASLPLLPRAHGDGDPRWRNDRLDRPPTHF